MQRPNCTETQVAGAPNGSYQTMVYIRPCKGFLRNHYNAMYACWGTHVGRKFSLGVKRVSGQLWHRSVTR